MMKKLWSFLFCMVLFSVGQGQHKVRFILKEKTAIQHDSIYVAGTFSDWDSTANKNYRLQPYPENEKSITLILKADSIRYKFHRGSWLKVEKSYWGEEVPDRVVAIKSDTTLTDSIMSWKDELFIDKWRVLAQTKSDSSIINILAAIAVNYAFSRENYNSDSALYYAQKALHLQQKIVASSESKRQINTDYSVQLINLQEVIAALLHSLGNYPKALEMRLENLKLAEKGKDKFRLVEAIRQITTDYISMQDYPKVLYNTKLLDSILSKQDNSNPGFVFENREAIYLRSYAFYKMGMLDSALYYAKKRAEIDTQLNNIYDLCFGNLLLADIYAAKGNTDAAMQTYRFVNTNSPNPIKYIAANAQGGMAKVFQKIGTLDSALLYANLALTYFQNNKLSVQSWGENSNFYIAEISPLVAELYNASNQPDSAYKYLRLSISIKDSLYNTDKIRQFQTLSFNDVARRQQLEQQSREAKHQYETKIKMYGLFSIITGFMLLAFVLYRNNKHKQKANKVLEQTLTNLKSTQSQLIQSEKMASLGELTAGIAHEIQNPLNFVNNFSEVNTELIEEMKEEIEKGNLDEVKLLANDIADNEQKINHHGKRADAIVKGMLQHSRSSSGVKEPTDINALADEYLRLAYHGLRAKDKSFNVTMKTDFDETIGNINIIPQDIGRVILNLITNAFYAVNIGKTTIDEKTTTVETRHAIETRHALSLQYEPTIWVTTKKIGDQVSISVRDNGPGIPPKVLDKIFQPFFTTKPTGQGTGLGLSLAYDIVKAHGGELKVETSEGEGSEFIIQIPMTV